MGDSKSQREVLNGFARIDCCVEIPFSIPIVDDSIVIVNFEVVVGFDLCVKMSSTVDLEPELDLVTEIVASFLSSDSLLDVDGCSIALGIYLHNSELFMDEVVGEEGVWLTREVTPWLYLDGFRL